MFQDVNNVMLWIPSWFILFVRLFKAATWNTVFCEKAIDIFTKSVSWSIYFGNMINLRVFFFLTAEILKVFQMLLYTVSLQIHDYKTPPFCWEQCILHHNEHCCSIEHSLGNSAVKVKDYSIVWLMLVIFII